MSWEYECRECDTMYRVSYSYKLRKVWKVKKQKYYHVDAM